MRCTVHDSHARYHGPSFTLGLERKLHELAGLASRTNVIRKLHILEFNSSLQGALVISCVHVASNSQREFRNVPLSPSRLAWSGIRGVHSPDSHPLLSRRRL